MILLGKQLTLACVLWPQIETIRVNVLGMLNLADICFEKQLHLTTYATGCIFHYDKDFPEGSGKGFKESDKPNFTGSYYSYTKVCFPFGESGIPVWDSSIWLVL
jgi:dTDP-4-dehydrorhamnose reductase